MNAEQENDMQDVRINWPLNAALRMQLFPVRTKSHNTSCWDQIPVGELPVILGAWSVCVCVMKVGCPSGRISGIIRSFLVHDERD